MRREERDGGDGVGRRTVLAGLCAGAATGLAGYAGADGSRTGRTGNERVGAEGTFVEATAATASGLHPLYDDDDASQLRLDKLYDGPGGRFGPDTFDPRWFASWELSDGHDVVEYTLRDDLRWGGGYGRLDAEDYVYLLENVVLLDGSDDWADLPNADDYRIGPREESIRYETTGPLSIRAELPEPRPRFLHEDPLLDQYALPKELLRPYVETRDRAGLREDPEIFDGDLAAGESTLGPYELDDWVRDSRTTFERNDDYYLTAHAEEEPFASHPAYDLSGAPHFERYEVQVLRDESTAVAAVRTGEVDRAEIDPLDVSRIRGSPDLDVWERPFSEGASWLYLNHRRNGWAPIRERPAVRRAIATLYDRETIVEEVYDGNGRPTATLHPEWGPYYPDDGALFDPDPSVERARELLAAGTGSDYGYDDVGAFVGPDGQQVTLRVVRVTGSPLIELSGEYLRTRLEAAGFDVRLEAKPWNALLLDYAINSADNVDGVDDPAWEVGAFNGGPWDQSTSNADWDLLLGIGFETDPYAPWGAIESAVAERGLANFSGYHQDRYDVADTLHRAATEREPAAREIATDLLGFLSRDVAVSPTHTDVQFAGYARTVGGFPGEETDWGARATSPFHEPDPARTLRRGAATVPETTETRDPSGTAPAPTTTTRTTAPTTTARSTTADTATSSTPARTDDSPPSTTPTASGATDDTGASAAPTSQPAATTRDDGTPTRADDTGPVDELPGFGPLAAVAGLGGLAELARRQSDADDGEA